MFSTELLLAPSISITSTERPSVTATHCSQTLHGSGVGPRSHTSAFAKMRAVVVLPSPRAPEKR